MPQSLRDIECTRSQQPRLRKEMYDLLPGKVQETNSVCDQFKYCTPQVEPI